MSAQPVSLLTDEELLSAVRDGDQRAYGDLWKRHSPAGMRAAHSFKHLGEPADLVSEAFTRIFAVLQSGSGPTGAFRPYLYTTIRNISLRNVHQHAAVTNVEIDFDTLAAPETAADSIELALDSSLTAVAFRSLPARWQEVLWYTEVERLTLAQTGGLMALKANAVSALAFRARAALRGAWLQSHINDDNLEGEHKRVLEKVGEYSQGGLSARDHALVSSHLQTCVRCSIITEEVEHAAGRLALIVLPLALGGPGALLFAHAIATGAPLPSASANPPRPSSPTPAVVSAAPGLSPVTIALIAAGVVAAAGIGIGAVQLGNFSQPTPSVEAPSQALPAPMPTATGATAVPSAVAPPIPAPPVGADDAEPVAGPRQGEALPTLASLSLAGGIQTLLTNNPTVTLTGTGVPGAQVLADGLPSARVDGSGNWTWTVAGLSDGIRHISLTAQLAGYLNSASKVFSIEVDTAAPMAPLVTSSWTSTQQIALEVAGSAESHATVTISTSGGTLLSEVIADELGHWESGVLAGFLPSMSELVVSQTDLAGNASAEATVGSFAFVPAYATPTDGAIFSPRTVPVTIHAWPGSSIVIILNGNPFGPLSVDSTGAISRTISSGGAALAAGQYTLATRYSGSATTSSPITFTITP